MIRLLRSILLRPVRAQLDLAATPRQKRIALAIAALADLLQLALPPLFAEGAFSPFDVILDLACASALLFTLGWRWGILVALGLELVPGLALCPSWTVFVMTLPTRVPAGSTTTEASIAPAAPRGALG
jgi:hypothetical protein